MNNKIACYHLGPYPTSCLSVSFLDSRMISRSGRVLRILPGVRQSVGLDLLTQQEGLRRIWIPRMPWGAPCHVGDWVEVRQNRHQWELCDQKSFFLSPDRWAWVRSLIDLCLATLKEGEHLPKDAFEHFLESVHHDDFQQKYLQTEISLLAALGWGVNISLGENVLNDLKKLSEHWKTHVLETLPWTRLWIQEG